MPEMLMIVLWFVLLAASLYVLLQAADYFVDTAELFGKKMNIPSFIVGATVVAFGTSLPELVVGMVSVFKAKPDIIAGTVLGSNISNIFLIGGIALIMSKAFNINFKKNAMEYLTMVGTAVMLGFFLSDFKIGLVESIICITILAAYVIYLVKFAPSDDDDEEDDEETSFGSKQVGMLLLSGVFIWAGGYFTVFAIEKISISLGLGSDIISQTVVALGTSLPELAVTIAAVRKLKFNLVIGNIVGSNIFNTVCVIGIPALVGYLSIGPEAFSMPEADYKMFSLPVMLIASFVLLITGFLKKTPQFFGYIFVSLYLLYIVGSFYGFDVTSVFASAQ